MAVEARYVGTRALQAVGQTFNYNEVNIVENGFLDEFRLAQQNLQANIAAGRGANVPPTSAPDTGTARCRSSWRTSAACRSAAGRRTRRATSALFATSTTS